MNLYGQKHKNAKRADKTVSSRKAVAKDAEVTNFLRLQQYQKSFLDWIEAETAHHSPGFSAFNHVR